jgi:hypothetical protein
MGRLGEGADEMTNYWPNGMLRPAVRNNGFAEGDRVAVIGGPWEGIIGKVYYSSIGCDHEVCRTQCKLLTITVMYKPPDKDCHLSQVRCKLAHVTHID